jgi:hypothetical protein
MKHQELICLAILLLTGFAVGQGEKKQPPSGSAPNTRLQFSGNVTTCDHLLLLNHQLEPIRFPTSEKNLICKNIKSNCCPLASQQMLFTQWVNSGTRDGIINLYGQFIKVINQILNNFNRVETFAKKVVDNTARRKQSSCRNFAESILALGISGQKAKILENVKKAYRFLYDARRGFSCSLCDAEAHKSISGVLGKITMSNFFCGQMVEATLPFSIFRHKYFLKIARSLGQFVSSCNVEGIYKPNRSMKYDIKFFKDNTLLSHIDKCQNNSKDTEAVTFCYDYCSHFNPIRYDAMFEGDIPKLLAYNAWLKKTMDKTVKANKSTFSKGDLKFEGRILSSKPGANTPTATPAQKGAGPVTVVAVNANSVKKKSLGYTGLDYSEEINNMRKEFGLQLKTGITYSASENFSFVFDINFKDSFYSQLPKSIYDLSKFTADFDKNGINYLYYGYATAMNDATNAQILTKKTGGASAAQPTGGQKQSDTGIKKAESNNSGGRKKKL